jgi:hypothetical protein
LSRFDLEKIVVIGGSFRFDNEKLLGPKDLFCFLLDINDITRIVYRLGVQLAVEGEK